MQIQVKKLNENAIMPKFEYDSDTGFSIYTCEDVTIKANKKAAIPTGLAFCLPNGYAFQVKNRSGITINGVTAYDNKGKEIKAQITVYEGTIDNGYRGEVAIMVKNNESFKITIPRGTKLAQGVIIQYYQAQFKEVENLPQTERNINGFGSTSDK